MDRESIVALLRRLHEAQNDFYGGGAGAALQDVLAGDVSWHVPGKNAIAGEYRGLGAVLDYFAKRRDLADGSFQMRSKGLLTGPGDWAASVTDGAAVRWGERLTWSTVGLYRFREGRIAACWLLPLDPGRFDRIWAGDRAPAGPVSTLTVRVQPRYCDAQGMVHASRYYEFFEDAFLAWLDEHAGGYQRIRAAGADMVVAASGCDHRRGAGLGDLLTLETHPSRVGRTSLSMSFTVRHDDAIVADGRTTYVAISTAGDGPTPLPAPLAAAVRDTGETAGRVG